MRLALNLPVLLALTAPAAALAQAPQPEMPRRADGPEMLPPPLVVQPVDEFSLQLPGREELFRLRSESAWKQSIIDEHRQRGIAKTEFPREPAPMMQPGDASRNYPPQVLWVPPATVCFRTLYFQDVTRDRYGKSWGVIEPAREAFRFWGEVLILPGMMVAVPPWRWQGWNYPFQP